MRYAALRQPGASVPWEPCREHDGHGDQEEKKRRVQARSRPSPDNTCERQRFLHSGEICKGWNIAKSACNRVWRFADCSFENSSRQYLAALTLALCAGCSTAPSRAPPANQALVVVSCPPRTPLADDSFGAWVLKAQELAQAYDRCRAAALASK